MAHVARLEDEAADAVGLAAILGGVGVQRHRIGRHSQVADRQSGEPLPFRHQAHAPQSGFQQRHIDLLPIGP